MLVHTLMSVRFNAIIILPLTIFENKMKGFSNENTGRSSVHMHRKQWDHMREQGKDIRLFKLRKWDKTQKTSRLRSNDKDTIIKVR